MLMRRRTFFQVATALATFGITGCTAPEGVPADRLARLARGVNMSHWFARRPSPAQCSNRATPPMSFARCAGAV